MVLLSEMGRAGGETDLGESQGLFWSQEANGPGKVEEQCGVWAGDVKGELLEWSWCGSQWE